MYAWLIACSRCLTLLPRFYLVVTYSYFVGSEQCVLCGGCVYSVSIFLKVGYSRCRLDFLGVFVICKNEASSVQAL